MLILTSIFETSYLFVFFFPFKKWWVQSLFSEMMWIYNIRYKIKSDTFHLNFLCLWFENFLFKKGVSSFHFWVHFPWIWIWCISLIETESSGGPWWMKKKMSSDRKPALPFLFTFFPLKKDTQIWQTPN